MRILLGSLLCVTLFTCFSVAFAESQPSVYKPIVGVPGLSNSGGYTTQAYVNAIYKLSITIGALIAVVQIIFQGVQYMFDGVITHKSDAIRKIRGAIVGLLIILSAVLLLNTINPKLTTLSIFNNAPSIDATNGAPQATLKAVNIGDKTSSGNNAQAQNIIRNCKGTAGTETLGARGATSIGCYAKASGINAKPGDTYNGTTYAPSERADANANFAKTCAANGGVYENNWSVDTCDTKQSLSVVKLGSAISLVGKSQAQQAQVLGFPDSCC